MRTYIAAVADHTFDDLANRISEVGTAMLIGGLDTGKTTVALSAARSALAAGRTPVLVDADVGNSTVGPPACVGMKAFRSEADFDALDRPDGLHFVGTITPSRLVLQQVVATAAMVDRARELGDLIIVDTSAVASGVAGETLKYHKAELCRPEIIVALQRGGEMEPVVGMLRRFLGANVITAPTDPSVVPVSPEARAYRRSEGFAAALRPPLETWRVRPTVFAPTLPMGLDLDRLKGVLVGVQDSTGGCLGIGVLDYESDSLRVMTNVGERMTGLRLGSIRLDVDTMQASFISLREVIFGI